MKATLELTFGFHNHFLYSDRTGALKRGERRAGPAARPKKGDRAVFLCGKNSGKAPPLRSLSCPKWPTNRQH